MERRFKGWLARRRKAQAQEEVAQTGRNDEHADGHAKPYKEATVCL